MKKNIFYAFFIFLTIFMISACSNNSTGPNGSGNNNSGNNNSGLVGTTWIADASKGEVMGVDYAALYFFDSSTVGVGWCKGRDSAIRYAKDKNANNHKDGNYDNSKITSEKKWASGSYTLSGNTLTIKNTSGYPDTKFTKVD